MAYVVVVFAMVNAGALGGIAWWLWRVGRDYPIIVEAAIQDEVRKQDNRIEKRLERAQGPDPDTGATDTEREYNGVQAGRPVRRR